jgi:F-type H+-transporting ATPase subunit c
LAFAEDVAASGDTQGAALSIASALAIGLAAFGGTWSQGRAVSAILEATGRNPGAASKMFTPLILGLVFIESLVIFSFVIAFNLANKI